MNTIATLKATQLGCIRQGKWIFPDVSFAVHAGEVLLIEGANGAGKSSLLRIIAGAATPAAGTIFCDDQSIHENLSAYTQQHHYIGHTNGIRLGLTVTENLQLAAELAQHPVTDMHAILSSLQLDALKNVQTQFLSAGQKRRTALARLFLLPRPLWILDEPLTSLDADTQQFLLNAIEKHTTAGGICIMTSHQAAELNCSVQHLRLSPC